jgi:hypothetical protein
VGQLAERRLGLRRKSSSDATTAVARLREVRPRRWNTEARCVLIVRSARQRRLGIWAFVKPAATSAMICRSRCRRARRARHSPNGRRIDICPSETDRTAAVSLSCPSRSSTRAGRRHQAFFASPLWSPGTTTTIPTSDAWPRAAGMTLANCTRSSMRRTSVSTASRSTAARLQPSGGSQSSARRALRHRSPSQRTRSGRSRPACARSRRAPSQSDFAVPRWPCTRYYEAARALLTSLARAPRPCITWRCGTRAAVGREQSGGSALRTLAILRRYTKLDLAAQTVARAVTATDVGYLLAVYRDPTRSLLAERDGYSFFARAVQLRCFCALTANAWEFPCRPKSRRRSSGSQSSLRYLRSRLRRWRRVTRPQGELDCAEHGARTAADQLVSERGGCRHGDDPGRRLRRRRRDRPPQRRCPSDRRRDVRQRAVAVRFQRSVLGGEGHVERGGRHRGVRRRRREAPFRSHGPYPLDSAAYATDYNEIKQIGALDSPTRTPLETHLTAFWQTNRRRTTTSWRSGSLPRSRSIRATTRGSSR